MNIPKLDINSLIKPFRFSIELVSRPLAKRNAALVLGDIRKTFLKHTLPIRLHSYLGSGGFADVFSATSDYNGVCEFAIKILRSELMRPRTGGKYDRDREEMRVKDIKKRFTNESYVQWSLSQNLSDRVSESVVKVFDHGEFDTRRR
jgi:hypothetical protein